jgi:antitoxin component YwqK of YwqJK toxin-antitoxin module
MLKRLFFLFFTSLPYLLSAQFADTSSSFYKAFYYESGQLSSEGILEEGKPNGYWITYYPNGLRKSEGNRLNFLLEGKWKFYDEKGNIENVITYEEGRKNGVYQYFNDSCILILEEQYKNDLKEGLQTEYWADTLGGEKIKSTIPFESNRENGIAYEYAKDGRIITITNYSKGFSKSVEKINRKDKQGRKQGIWKTFYKNGKLKVEERYKNDLLNGYRKEYNVNGKLEKAVLYVNGEIQDNEENIADFDIGNTYYDDGTVKSTTIYNKAGKKDGVSTSYDSDGKITATEIYKNGVLLSKGVIDEEGLYQGMWEFYYLNGNIRSKGEYKDGNKFGKWKYYFTSGKLEQEGAYDQNGKFSGEWKWYYENGNLLRREEYRRGIEDGNFEEYTSSGEIITKGEYFDGEKEGSWLYQLNDHKESGEYRYGQRNGEWVFKHTNGKVAFEGSFQEGIPEGRHRYFNANGILIKEENYSYGEKDGKWRWFDSNGIEILSIDYKDGEERKINGERVKFSDK